METETYNKARQINQRIHAIMTNIELLEKGVASIWGKTNEIKLVNFFAEGHGNFPYKYAEIPSISTQLLIDMLTAQINQHHIELEALKKEFKAI